MWHICAYASKEVALEQQPPALNQIQIKFKHNGIWFIAQTIVNSGELWRTFLVNNGVIREVTTLRMWRDEDRRRKVQIQKCLVTKSCDPRQECDIVHSFIKSMPTNHEVLKRKRKRKKKSYRSFDAATNFVTKSMMSSTRPFVGFWRLFCNSIYQTSTMRKMREMGILELALFGAGN